MSISLLTKVRSTIESIETANDFKDLRNVYESVYLSESIVPKKNRLNLIKYPEIRFSISSHDIDEIKSLGNSLSEILKKDKKFTSLEKLMISILWKNGDFGKERHILDGVKNTHPISKRNEGLVFYQFGRRLENPDINPIIDQHILRAYLHFKSPQDEEILRLGQLSKKQAPEIEDYIKWVNTQCNRIIQGSNSTNAREILFKIDQILFALGKAIKKK